MTAGALAVLYAILGAPATAVSPEEAERAVLQALAAQTSERAQADELAQLAWLRDGVPPAVAERARVELERFGWHAIPTLAETLHHVSPEDSASVVSTLIVARDSHAVGIPESFLPALVDVLWVGSSEAKRLAIPRIAIAKHPLSVLPLVDSALEDPALLPDVVQALGAIGDDRARFFLEKTLHESGPGVREGSAVALARIGGRALVALRDGMRSTNRDVRLASVRALLPVAGEDDLTALYVYLTEHEGDDPATARAVRAAAETIEEYREARLASEAASAPKDF